MRRNSTKIILLHVVYLLLYSGCSYMNVPPDTNENCIQGIYQKKRSGGAQIYESYNMSLHSSTDSTPGTTYETYKAMRACADGNVFDIIELDTGRLGGKMVFIAHGIDRQRRGDGDRYGHKFVTSYAHLEKLNVELGQQVKRGDLIGKAGSYRTPKLLLRVNGNWENPDNWGPDHGLMVDRDKVKIDNWDSIDGMVRKFNIQFKIIEDIYNYAGISRAYWFNYQHNPKRRYDAIANWSLTEHMRYLECLYKTEPEKFTGLSNDYFNFKRDEFYSNQPMVLTLPF